MHEYRIFTDGGSDLPAAWCAAHKVTVIPMYYEISSAAPEQYPGKGNFQRETFYGMLRSGSVARTASPSIEDCKALLRPVVSAGMDVLYVGLSSALSGTYNVVRLAMEELGEEFPERSLVALDSLCGSLGQGLLTELLAEQREQGMEFQALCTLAEQLKHRILHVFTVEDLAFLKRSGRINGATALAGTMLRIMPLFHMSAEGRLEPTGKVRGRQTALRSLADSTVEHLAPGSTVYIGHCDAEADARATREMIRRKCPACTVVVRPIGPIIGAHGGPGTLAVFSLTAE